MLSQADFAVAGECQGHVVGDSVISMAQSADGTKIASGDKNRKTITYDTASKEKIYSYGEQKDKILSLSFSPVSNELVALS